MLPTHIIYLVVVFSLVVSLFNFDI